MLRGGNQDAFLHQAGSVTDPGHIPGLGFDDESFKVGALEQDARVGRGGTETEVNPDTRVESDSRNRNGRGKRVLVG